MLEIDKSQSKVTSKHGCVKSTTKCARREQAFHSQVEVMRFTYLYKIISIPNFSRLNIAKILKDITQRKPSLKWLQCISTVEKA